MSEVKPCPFCGPEWASKLEVQDVGDGAFMVSCGHCQCLGPSAGDHDDAIRYWNEWRPIEDSLRAELADARRRVGELEAVMRRVLEESFEGSQDDKPCLTCCSVNEAAQVALGGNVDEYMRDYHTKLTACAEAKDLRARLKRALDVLKELRDLMEATRSGEYKPDSFTCQPANEILATEEGK